MIDAELLELLESVVRLAPVASRALDGKKSYGEDVEIRAHISTEHRLVRNAQGQEVASSGSADLDGAYPSVKESSRITLPDGSQPTIVAVATSYDSSGPYQTTVYF